MEKHISSRRKDDAQQKIKAKIKVLEGYLANGVPEGTYVPSDEASFRRWEDSLLGLEKIGSPNTMNKPYNQALKQRVGEILKELVNRSHRRERRAQVIERLRNDNKAKDRMIRGLAGQWHATKHELDRARQNERRLVNRVVELERETVELTRKLSSITGLRSISGGGRVDHDNK